MKHFFTIILSFLILGSTFGQSRPFPQNIDYEFGIKPTNITTEDFNEVYEIWKDKYLVSCGTDYLMVEFQEAGRSVSEGMGYGMVLTAYAGDKEEFDLLWNFTRKNWNSNHVMGWKVDCDGFIEEDGGSGAATDGDLDIAFALVVATQQWGKEYMGDALAYINRIKEKMFEYCSETDLWMLKAGDEHGGCQYSNSSYWMPGYYHVFAEVSGDDFWYKAIEDAYTLYILNRDETTGFNSNHINQYGNPDRDNQYKVDYNGCRTPWRLIKDYLWFGDTIAYNMTNKLSEWAHSEGIHTVVDGYKPDGTPTGTWQKSNPWTGAWACGAMSGDQERLDNFTAHFLSCNTDDGYYHTSLRALYMLTLTGNMWKPEFKADTVDQLSLTPYIANIEAKKDSFLLDVFANTSWQLQTAASWLVPEMVSSTTSSSFYIVAQENPDTISRTDTIFVHTTDLSVTKKVIVNQDGKSNIPIFVNITSAPDSVKVNQNIMVRFDYSTSIDGTLMVDLFRDDVDDDDFSYSFWFGGIQQGVSAGSNGNTMLVVPQAKEQIPGDNYFMSLTLKNSDGKNVATQEKWFKIYEEKDEPIDTTDTNVSNTHIESTLISKYHKVGNSLHLQLNKKQFEVTQIEAYSMLGRKIYTKTTTANHTEIPISSNAPVIIRVVNNLKTEAIKVLP